MADVEVLEGVGATIAVANLNGQNSFDFDFLAYTGNSVLVSFRPDTEATPLELGVDFTVAGLSQANGGTITLIGAFAGVAQIGDKVLMYRSTPIERRFDYQNSGDFRAETVNRELDIMIMIDQENRRDIDRAVKTPIGVPPIALLPGAPGTIAGFGANGDLGGTGIPTSLLDTLAGLEAGRALVYPAAPANPVYDAGGRRIGNLGTAVNPGDAVPLSQFASLLNIGYAPTIAALKNIDPTNTKAVVVRDERRGGLFFWTEGDFTSRIAADPNEGLIAKANAVPAAVGAWVRDWQGTALSSWWGTLGNGVADDSAAMNAAAAALGNVGGGTLKLPASSATYRLRNVLIPSRVVVDARLADIRAIGGNSSAAIWLLHGTASGTRRAISNVAAGSILVTCTTPAQAGEFAAGDYVFIQNEVFASPGSFGKNREIARVSAVNAGTGQVSLESRLLGVYTGSTPTIEKITPVVDAHVIGGSSFLADASASEGGHISIDIGVRCSIQGATIEGVNSLPGIRVRRSADIDVYRNRIRNGHRMTLGGYGWGIGIEEHSQSVRVLENVTSNIREMNCTDRCRFVIFSRNHCFGHYVNGINSHSSTNSNVSIVDNYIQGTSVGVGIAFGQSSGSNSDSVGIVSRNIISNTFSDGIQIVATGSTTTKVICANNIINGFGLNASGSAGIFTNFVDDIHIVGNQIIAGEALSNCYGISINNTVWGVVSDNIIDGGAFGIGVAVGGSIMVQSNRMRGIATQSVRVASPDSSSVWFLDNFANTSNQSINGTGTYQHRNSWNTLP